MIATSFEESLSAFRRCLRSYNVVEAIQEYTIMFLRGTGSFKLFSCTGMIHSSLRHALLFLPGRPKICFDRGMIRVAKRTFDDDQEREAGILWSRSVLSPSKHRIIGNMFCIRSYSKASVRSCFSSVATELRRDKTSLKLIFFTTVDLFFCVRLLCSRRNIFFAFWPSKRVS